MGKRLPGGLRTEIVASVALLTLVAILLVGTLMIQALEQGFISEQVRGTRRLKNVVQASIWGMVRAADEGSHAGIRTQAEDLLAELMEEKDADLLWVDAEGRVMGGRAPVAPGEIWLDQDLRTCLRTGQEVTQVSPGEGGWWPFWGPRSLTLSAPLNTPQGKPYGAIRVQVPLRGMWGCLFRSSWVLGLYILLVMGVLVLFGSYLISRNVLHPLTRLMQASERIARGDYEFTWEGYPPHEMGRLAEALERMAQKLKTHQAALKDRLEDLERSNRALVQAHQAMIRSEKLASVGRLAAGVAHEIGNPIGSILGYVGILLSQATDPASRDCLQRIRTEAERIQRTLRSLLDLARPAGRQLEWVNVESVVDETLGMMAGHKGMKGIELRRHTQGDLRPIWADQDQIKQVVVNLLLNSLDALDGEGSLAINTGTVPILPENEDFVPPPRRRGEPSDSDFTSLRRSPPHALLPGLGPFVFIRVEDTGSGIPSENLQHLFEPFYTTKDPGEGTGLGLTVCLGIVESYGGRIHVKSQPGVGSCFSVYFPSGRAGEERPSEQAPALG